MTEEAPAPLPEDAARPRRQADALRLMTWLGAGLFLLPGLLLSGRAEAAGATAPWGLYLFAAWGALVVLAALLAAPRRRRAAAAAGPEAPPR